MLKTSSDSEAENDLMPEKLPLLNGGPPTTVRSLSPVQAKPIKLRNYIVNQDTYDTLNQHTTQNVPCQSRLCRGSSMFPNELSNPGVSIKPSDVVLSDAKTFIDQYYTSNRRYNSPAHLKRWQEIVSEIEVRGTYTLTSTELTYGAKLAWRNAPRCIGRIQWQKLQVFDARFVTTPTAMFEAICTHIKYATNKGNLRSAITIFPQRTDITRDFRIWNKMMISYAGYKQPDGSVIGDPMNCEFTELCQKMGWKGNSSRFDVLPLVLQAYGQDPECFEIPSELVLEVQLHHPTYKWFAEMGLKWYALPGVSNMLLDCGGVEFCACPFSGWYMVTEIASRDLCDTHRYNILEEVGKKMHLDTSAHTSLWKDKATVEVNIAVMYSFQKDNVTIMDHHSAAESFQKHFEQETRTRGGCPTDWVWVVPPLNGSLTWIFHQEFAFYISKPAYLYQNECWRTYQWKKDKDQGGKVLKAHRKFSFREIARAVKFTSKLFGRALSKRIKATILYATETGKSETFAQKLTEIFSHAFNAMIYSMDEYDFCHIEHEALLLVVTSTFGNGDPPGNGEAFAKNLQHLKASLHDNEDRHQDKSDVKRTTSLLRMTSTSNEKTTSSVPLERIDSFSDVFVDEGFGPLSNVRFGVFALGSSAYPNFCTFGRWVDQFLGDLGGERLAKVACGDEMAGQEQAFRTWAKHIFHVSCETFCLEDDVPLSEATALLHSDAGVSAEKVRFTKPMDEYPLQALFSSGNVRCSPADYLKCHMKQVHPCTVIRTYQLHDHKIGRATIGIELETHGNKSLLYEPGDHVGIYPGNQECLVTGVLQYLTDVKEFWDQPSQLQILKEMHGPTGISGSWEDHERLPPVSLRTLLMRFIDITSPPSPDVLNALATMAKLPLHSNKLKKLATDAGLYEEWKHRRYPHLLEVLQEFPSIADGINSALLLSLLPMLQVRFYSISSSSDMHRNQIHLTVAVVTYRTEYGKGPVHYGVCSNYLRDLQPGNVVTTFVRSAASFHLPPEISTPIILVGPGTGIAPFRSFWQHRYMQMKKQQQKGKCATWGSIDLFVGCRLKELQLYREEIKSMVSHNVISKVHLALSREPGISKTYVQHKILEVGEKIYRHLGEGNGHIYVCGDCTMAEDVNKTISGIMKKYGRMSDSQADSFMINLRESTRYHEDIFGITLRTAEVTNRSRKTALSRMSSNMSLQ